MAEFVAVTASNHGQQLPAVYSLDVQRLDCPFCHDWTVVTVESYDAEVYVCRGCKAQMKLPKGQV